MGEHQGFKLPNGTRLQAGIPTRFVPAQAGRARGLMVRGAVTATYVMDDAGHPTADDEGRAPVAVYCDVMVTSHLRGNHWFFLPKCLVSQDRGGLHRGAIWKPRAATVDVTDNPMDLDKGTNPANLDGDHVLVGFIDDLLSHPVILRGIPHPSADVGNEQAPLGNRMKLQLADGDPEFWKHHGSFFGISDQGDFAVDTTRANDGGLDADGKEAAPPTDGKGSVAFKLPQDAQQLTELLDMSDVDAPEMVARAELDKVLLRHSFTDAAAVIEYLIDSAGTPTREKLEKAKKLIELADAAGVLELKVDGGDTLNVAKKDGNATLALGDGAVHAIIAETFAQWWDLTIRPLFIASDAHVHPTGVGPSGPPSPLVNLPTYDTGNDSTKVSFPDG